MIHNRKLGQKLTVLAALFASSIVIPAAPTRAAQGKDRPGVAAPAVVSPKVAPVPASTPAPNSKSRDLRSPREDRMLRQLWGIQDVHVRETASGSILRFSYRVVDSAKAKVLNDPKLNPVLMDANSGEKLAVPETENAGKLRQVAPPEDGREYWMVFLNNDRIIRPGSRVNIRIGTFRADGLVVEPSMPVTSGKKP